MTKRHYALSPATQLQVLAVIVARSIKWATPMQGVQRSSLIMRGAYDVEPLGQEYAMLGKRDPELPPDRRSTYSSGWIARWIPTGSYRQRSPRDRGHDFCCAGQVDSPPMIDRLIRPSVRDIYPAIELVIAIRPHCVLNIILTPMPSTQLSTKPLHQLSNFSHWSEDRIARFIKLDPWRAIRSPKESRLGPIMPTIRRMVSYPLMHHFSGAGPLQHRIEYRRLNRIVCYGERALGRRGRVTGSHLLIVPMRQDVV